MDNLTLEEAWLRAGQHAQLARDLAGIVPPAARIPHVAGAVQIGATGDDGLDLRLAAVHAALGQAYATLAHAAATGLQSNDLDLRERWEHLTTPADLGDGA